MPNIHPPRRTHKPNHANMQTHITSTHRHTFKPSPHEFKRKHTQKSLCDYSNEIKHPANHRGPEVLI